MLESQVASMASPDAPVSGAGEPSIKIFVTGHKRAVRPKSKILLPVQVGPGLKDDRFADTLHDDEGENVSELNPYLCELTTQYWAWKNQHADYVGFCHYRRYFSFAVQRFDENPYGEVMEPRISVAACERYGLYDEAIRQRVKDFDVLTTTNTDISQFPEEFATLREHWHAAPYLQDKDLELMARIVERLHPDYTSDTEAFLEGHHARFCNMFIMRWDIFEEYCAWLFPLLKEFMDEADMAHYSVEALRTPGHLGERLLNIYLLHQQRLHPEWRFAELQCVHFVHTDPRMRPTGVPLKLRGEKQVIPVALAADDGYCAQVATVVRSILDNGSHDRFFDILVLERDISAAHISLLQETVQQFDNVRLCFCDVAPYVAGEDLSTNNEHISAETFYRFLIPELLPFYDKVLYLDSDIVVLGDVAELFDVDLKDNILAATRDIDFLGNLNGSPVSKSEFDKQGRMAYAKNVLQLKDPYSYFQAGVLVLNTEAMRRLHSTAEWFSIVRSSNFIYDDQDILNRECEGRVLFLDLAWDVTHDNSNRIQEVYSFAPAELYHAYLAAREHPQIIHYAGFQKPWLYATVDLAPVWWSYARKTPFYEQTLAVLCDARRLKFVEIRKKDPVMGKKNPLRHVIDPLLPVGSPAREKLKESIRKLKSPQK
jgi:lipopolysaccharide biosynthesis glycosyltransferase